MGPRACNGSPGARVMVRVERERCWDVEGGLPWRDAGLMGFLVSLLGPGEVEEEESEEISMIWDRFPFPSFWADCSTAC